MVYAYLLLCFEKYYAKQQERSSHHELPRRRLSRQKGKERQKERKFPLVFAKNVKIKNRMSLLHDLCTATLSLSKTRTESKSRPGPKTGPRPKSRCYSSSYSNRFRIRSKPGPKTRPTCNSRRFRPKQEQDQHTIQSANQEGAEVDQDQHTTQNPLIIGPSPERTSQNTDTTATLNTVVTPTINSIQIQLQH